MVLYGSCSGRYRGSCMGSGRSSGSGRGRVVMVVGVVV